MAFEIRVNGQKFTLWESATLIRSIDTNSGTFRFSSSNTNPASFPVRVGDEVSIVIDGVSKLQGFVDVVTGDMSSRSHTINVSGRDNVADLIDSSVPDAAKTIAAPITLKAMCEKVIGALGANIEVVNSVGGSATVNASVDEFRESDGISADSGRPCMDFLTSFARKKQLYLVPSGDGKLVIYRPGRVRASSPILNRVDNPSNNVISYSVTYDHSTRFGRYRATSQGNAGSFEEFAADDVDIKGNSVDGSIRATRYLEFQTEESMSSDECAKRAIEEANIRKTRATEYAVTVQGVTQSDGALWDFGQLVKIDDEFADVRGIFLIRAVEYSVSVNDGTRTRLVCCPPDGYNVRIGDEADSRRATQGPKLQTGTS